MTVIILTAVYTGNLTASLAVNIVKAPFSTLKELAADTSYVLGVPGGSMQQQILQVTLIHNIILYLDMAYIIHYIEHMLNNFNIRKI
jgi:gamma-glutamyltranspeptidase